MTQSHSKQPLRPSSGTLYGKVTHASCQRALQIGYLMSSISAKRQPCLCACTMPSKLCSKDFLQEEGLFFLQIHSADFLQIHSADQVMSILMAWKLEAGLCEECLQLLTAMASASQQPSIANA